MSPYTVLKLHNILFLDGRDPILAEDKVVGTEDLSVGSGADAVHGARLQVNKDGAGDIVAAAGLVVVHVDPLKL